MEVEHFPLVYLLFPVNQTHVSESGGGRHPAVLTPPENKKEALYGQNAEVGPDASARQGKLEEAMQDFISLKKLCFD